MSDINNKQRCNNTKITEEKKRRVQNKKRKPWIPQHHLHKSAALCIRSHLVANLLCLLICTLYSQFISSILTIPIFITVVDTFPLLLEYLRLAIRHLVIKRELSTLATLPRAICVSRCPALHLREPVHLVPLPARCTRKSLETHVSTPWHSSYQDLSLKTLAQLK